MKQHLRVVAEVAVVGSAAMTATVLLPLLISSITIAVANLLCMIEPSEGLVNGVLRVTSLSFVVCWIAPFCAAFLYGFKRKLQLSFVAVWIGWAIGWVLYGQITSMTLNSVFPPKHHKAVTAHAHWWGWPLWIGWLFAFSLLPALVTMWGQRRRIRAAQSR